MPNSTMDDIEFEKFAVGQPVSRLEDPMLLRGDGIYTDDINLDGQAYARPALTIRAWPYPETGCQRGWGG